MILSAKKGQSSSPFHKSTPVIIDSLFWELTFLGVDFLGVDILEVDILRLTP